MSADKQNTGTTCSPLRHPLRVRILEVVNEQDMSPVRFIDEGLIPDQAEYESRQNALSLVSYHFRELEKAGCLEIVDTFQRRGATEHVYRGSDRAFYSNEEFDRLPYDFRRHLSRTGFQGLAARADSAMIAGTFDARTDRHLTWVAIQADERAWDEVMTALLTCFEEIERIKHDARVRLAGSGDNVVPLTVGILGFESPPPPRRP
jgi:hypothetical protein